jgi:dipeptidyl aminopeptidase/acylaminoacyl peptidase
MTVLGRAIVATLIVSACVAPAAHAAFPGANGKIAFARAGAIWTMEPDGSQPTQITSGTSSLPDAAPAWSPDGTEIAFQRRRPACSSGICSDIWIAGADGSSPALAISDAATPAWSPGGTQLTFIARDPALPGTDTIWKANLDGTGRTEVYDYEEADQFGIGAPAWSPDGSKILFHEGTLESVCNPDLEECANLYPEYLYTTPASPPNTQTFGGPRTPGAAPNWSPDGQRHAFHTPAQTPDFEIGDVGGRIGLESDDGSGRQLLTPGAGYAGRPGFDSRPAWSPDGSRIAFERYDDGIHVINVDGTGDIRLSAIGTDPDWQPVQRAYVRPAGATPLRVPLVPAFEPCSGSNRTHGPPLAFPSCAPPIAASPNLTVGVGDGDPATARSIGFVRLRVVRGAPGGADDADVVIRFSLSNVMWSSDLTDYTGILQPEAVVRLTDRAGFQHQTVQDFPFGFVVPCAATSGTFDGALCALTTSAEAVLPGSITEGSRAILALDRVKVYDGGPTGDGGDPSLFSVQGVFVP